MEVVAPVLSGIGRAFRFPSDAGSRISAVDGLRGVAILIVMAHHYGTFFEPPSLRGVLSTGAELGWVGVDLFFVISGFLITGILLGAKGRARYFRNFYARRFLRIFPLFYAVLLLRFVVFPFLGHPLPPHLAAAPQMFWLYLSNFVPSLGDRVDAIDVSWSLAIEEQFYLVWPLIVLLLPTRWLARLLVTVLAVGLGLRILAVMSGVSADELYHATPYRLDGLAVGALLAIAARNPAWFGRVRTWAAPALVLGGLMLVALGVTSGGFGREQPLIETAGYVLIAGVFGSLLAVLVTSPPGSRTSRAFSLRPLRVVGQLSYALYLFHLAIAGLVSHIVLGGSAGIVQFGVFVVIAAGLTFASALLSWNLWEARWLDLKRLFADRPPRDPIPTSSPVTQFIREVPCSASSPQHAV